MKKYFVLFFLFGATLALFTSCEKEDGDEMEFLESRSNNFAWNDSLVTDYPAAIDDYVAQNFPEATIDAVILNEDGSYTVELSSDIELLFDADGNFIEEIIEGASNEEEGEEEEEDDSIVTNYPATIDDYIAQNFPGAAIEEVELTTEGDYEVELNNDTELLFDAMGNFVEEIIEEDNDEEAEMEDDEDAIVTDYPTAIDDYVAQNHPDTTIEEVVLTSEGDYEVELSDGTELLFDADGNFIE